MKVLIIGLGSIAQKHILAIRNQYVDVTFYALRSSKDAAEEENIINLFDVDELKAFKFDFAIISNPTSLHHKAIETLIPYNIPLFIEKPIFDTLEIGNLFAELEQKEIITYVACNLRFLGCISFLREFLEGKMVNEVNAYCGSYLPDWRPGKDFREVYSANKEMGGGVHIDLIHEIDYVFWLFGQPTDVKVVKRSESSLDISAIDYANFLFLYPNYCASIVLNYYRRDAKRTLEILLDDGTVYVDLLKNEVEFKNEIIYKSEKRIIDTYENQIKFFIDQVLPHKIKFNTANEAFQILELCITND